MKNARLLNFDEVIIDVTRNFKKIHASQYQTIGETPVIDQSASEISGYTNLKPEIKQVSPPYIIFGDHTRRLKFSEVDFVLGADGTKVLKPKIDADHKYLFHALRFLKIEEAGYSRHFKFLKRKKILIPPLAEQRRIAEQLDTADRILRLREQAIEKLDQLAQSVFAKNFSMSEKTEKIGSLFAINKNGLDMSISDEDEIGFIPMAAISEHTKAIEIYEQRKFYEVRKGYTPIKRGDLLVAKITPCYENGKMAIAEFPNGEYAFGSTEFHTFRSDNPLMITYLYYFLMDEKIRLDGARNMRGAAGQRRVPAEYFSNLDIPIPPPDDLATFCRFVTETNKLRAKASDAIKSSKALIASLQCQSFAVN